MIKKAIVTLIIGEYHRRMWEILFKDTWERYAKKHGYDIVTISEYIDDTSFGHSRGPHWQKCLILDHPDVAKYDRVVWMDSDVLINYHTAKCIVSEVPPGKIGGVSYMQANGATPKLKAVREDRWVRLINYFGDQDPWKLGRFPTPQEIYRFGGVETDASDWTNTGVIVLDVHNHRELLRSVYETGIERDNSFWEMIPLSAAIMDSGQFHAIDTRYNVDYMYEMAEYAPYLFLGNFSKSNSSRELFARILTVNLIWQNNFFIHCVGGAPKVREDIRWIFREAGEFDAFLFEFK